jgi:MFS family permease
LVLIPLGILLGSRLGWQGPFYLYACSLVLALGVIKYTWEPSKSPNNVSHSSDLQPQLAYFDLPWLRLFALCTLTLVSAEMFYGSMVHGATALGELGVRDPGAMGIYLSLVVLGLPLGALIFRLLSHLKVAVMITLAFLLTSAGFWFIGHTDNPIDYTLAAFSIQLGCGLVLPTLLVWTTDSLAYSIRGRGHGLWQSAFAIGQLVSGITVSYFTVELGSLLASFNVLAVVALLTAIGALVWMLGGFLLNPRAHGNAT